MSFVVGFSYITSIPDNIETAAPNRKLFGYKLNYLVSNKLHLPIQHKLLVESKKHYGIKLFCPHPRPRQDWIRNQPSLDCNHRPTPPTIILISGHSVLRIIAQIPSFQIRHIKEKNNYLYARNNL